MAGVMGFFNFEKPGRGVNKNEEKKTGLLLFFSVFYRKFWKVLQLNLLYLLFCIPIVTIGPATAALTYVLRKFSEEKHAWVWTDFWDEFKANFKQGLIFGLFDFIVYGICAYCVYLYFVNTIAGTLTHLQYFCIALVVVYAVVYTIMRFYIYTFMVSYRLTVLQILMNSFILAFAKLPLNLLIMAICAVLLYLHYKVPFIGYLAIFYIIPLLGLLINVYVYPVIQEMLSKQE